MSERLTFLLWLWKRTQPDGWNRDYNAVHVNTLALMLKENIRQQHEIKTITDMPDGINTEIIPLWEHGSVVVTHRLKPNCYKRLYAFSKDAKGLLGDLLINFDLDCVVLGDISHLFDDLPDFKITRGNAAPYNGSLWALRAGMRPDVWDSFDPIISPSYLSAQKHPITGKPLVGSDQAWISERLFRNNEETWGEEHGVYFWANILNNHNKTLPANAKIVFFAGKHKPWSLAIRNQCPELYFAYQDYYSKVSVA